MNKYLLKYKKRKQQGSANPFSTAYDYWMNKGLGGFSEFADAASEYSETVEAEDKRNEKAYLFKMELAKKYRDAGPWNPNVEKRLIFIDKAYPNLPSVSTALGIAPNSESDSYAQGAIVAFVSALLFPEHKSEFQALGDKFLKEATKANDQQDGPRTQRTARIVAREWDDVALKAGVLTAWYNVIGQIRNLFTGDGLQARQIENRLDMFSKANEIDLAQQIAKDSQSSVTDLLYEIRGVLALGGGIIAAIYLYPLIAPNLGVIGRSTATATKELGKAGVSTAKSVGKATKKLTTMLNKKVYKPLTKALDDAAKSQDFKSALKKIEKVVEDKSLDFSSKIKQDVVIAQRNVERLTEEDIQRIVQAVVLETDKLKSRG